MDALDIVTTHLKFNDFICTQFTFLNQAMTGYYNEQLPLGVLSVLSFGDARLTDIDAHLTCIEGMNQLSK